MAPPGGDPGPEPWVVSLGDQRFELRPTDAGQVGLFPEQAANRAWLGTPVRTVGGAPTRPAPVRLHRRDDAGAAAAGARVTHVDASRPAVAWARRNAELSGLADRPIRWIVDDARGSSGARPAAAGVRRPRPRPAELRARAVAARRSWEFEERLAALLDACAPSAGRDPGSSS